MSKVSQKSNMKRRHYLMAQDNSSAYGDYPKPKKSKTSQDIIYSSFWAQLPSLLLHNVFDLLSDEDRRNASLVCKHWRQNSFHPKWWTKMTFRIEENNLEKARFIIYTFGKIVTDARIVVNSLSQECMEEFIQLLRLLSDNNNLRSLYLEPTHCRFEAPYKCFNSNEDDPWGIIPLLLPCLPNLVKFSIGCIEDLCYFIEDILKHLDPTKVTHLGLASVKDDPINYQPCCFDPELLAPFNKLEVITIVVTYRVSQNGPAICRVIDRQTKGRGGVRWALFASTFLTFSVAIMPYTSEQQAFCIRAYFENN
nr:unnamed protein product [Callosobruchus analis]